MKQSTLIITGMPRSGTSFTASVLQQAGLNIGQKLMAPGHGNVKGFFEDLDVVAFHESVLRSQGIHHVGWTLQESIRVNESDVHRAKALIAHPANATRWGWKDPRTTLFLDFWAELLPEACFLFVYRAPWEVADSIYRRGDEWFVQEPELAIKIWIHYNRLLLQFYDRFPSRCLIASVYSVARQMPEFIQAINARFNTGLTLPAPGLFEQSLLRTGASDAYRPALVAQLFPEALRLYRALNEREWETGLQPAPFTANPHPQETNSMEAFRDWLTVRRLENQVKRLREELEQMQSQLSDTQVMEVYRESTL